MNAKEIFRANDLAKEIELILSDAEEYKGVILDNHVHKFREFNTLQTRLLLETHEDLLETMKLIKEIKENLT